jgi:hypothetical protein
LEPVAEGWAKDRAEARQLAEAAVAAYFANRVEPSGGGVRAMTDGPAALLFWRALDRMDYWLTLAELRILDALAGSLPETPADRQRQRDRERMERPRSTVISS